MRARETAAILGAGLEPSRTGEPARPGAGRKPAAVIDAIAKRATRAAPRRAGRPRARPGRAGGEAAGRPGRHRVQEGRGLRHRRRRAMPGGPGTLRWLLPPTACAGWRAEARGGHRQPRLPAPAWPAPSTARPGWPTRALGAAGYGDVRVTVTSPGPRPTPMRLAREARVRPAPRWWSRGAAMARSTSVASALINASAFRSGSCRRDRATAWPATWACRSIRRRGPRRRGPRSRPHHRRRRDQRLAVLQRRGSRPRRRIAHAFAANQGRRGPGATCKSAPAS